MDEKQQSVQIQVDSIPILDYRKRSTLPPPPIIFNNFSLEKNFYEWEATSIDLLHALQIKILNQVRNGNICFSIPIQNNLGRHHNIRKLFDAYSDFITVIDVQPKKIKFLMPESIESPPIDKWSNDLIQTYKFVIGYHIYKIDRRIKKNIKSSLQKLQYRNFMDVVYTYFVDTIGRENCKTYIKHY